MVLEKPRSPLDLRDIPQPKPMPGEVLIRVRACAVCRTDLHVVDGELPNPKLPLVPGHEIVGTVVEAGDGAKLEAVFARSRTARSAWQERAAPSQKPSPARSATDDASK